MDNLYWAQIVIDSFSFLPLTYEGDPQIFILPRPMRMRFIRFRVLSYFDIGPALLTFLPETPGK